MGCTCSAPMGPVLIPKEKRNFSGAAGPSAWSRRSNNSRSNRSAAGGVPPGDMMAEQQGTASASDHRTTPSDRNPLMARLPTFGERAEDAVMADDEAENLWIAADRIILLEELENRRSMWHLQQMRDQRVLAAQLEDAATLANRIVPEGERRPSSPTDGVNSTVETEQAWEGGSNYMELSMGHRTPAEPLHLAHPQHEENNAANPGGLVGLEQVEARGSPSLPRSSARDSVSLSSAKLTSRSGERTPAERTSLLSPHSVALGHA